MRRFIAIAVLAAVLLTVAVSDTVTAKPSKEFKPFRYAVFAWKKLTVSGNVRTDSYGSPYTRKTAKQGGHIRSNKLVQLKGSVMVCGDAYSAAEIEIDGKAQITGKQYPDSLLYEIPRLRPFFRRFAKAEFNLNSEIRNSEQGNEPLDTDGDFTLTGKDCYTLAPGNYCFRNLKLTGGATLDVRIRANIYVTGSIKVTGGSRINYWLKDASKCMIMSQSGDITIGGNSKVYAMIYAPESPVVIEGTADVFGSVIGGEVTLKGDAQVHLPEVVQSFTIDVNVETLEPTKIWPPPCPPKPLVKGLLVCPDPAKPMLVNTKRWYNVHVLNAFGNVIPLRAFPTRRSPQLTQVGVADTNIGEPVKIEPKRLKYRMSALTKGQTTVHLDVTVPTNPLTDRIVSKDVPLIVKGPLEVVDVFPECGAVDVSPFTRIWFKFSEPVNPETVDFDTFKVCVLTDIPPQPPAPEIMAAAKKKARVNPNSNTCIPVDGTYSFEQDNTVAIFTPDQPLLGGATIYRGVGEYVQDKSVEDAFGNPLEGVTHCHFYTIMGEVEIDLDIIKPKPWSEPIELWDEITENNIGEVVPVNIDDDDKDSKAGHGKFPTPDKDDTDGVKGENDLIRLKIHKLEGEKGKFVLKYDKSHIVLWKKPTKEEKDRIKSEVTPFPTNQDTIVYVEGIKECAKGEKKTVTLQLKQAGEVKGKDEVKIIVAKTIIVLFGDRHVPMWSQGRGSIESYLRTDGNRKTVKGFKDPRHHPYIFKGKGRDVYYSIWSYWREMEVGQWTKGYEWQEEKGFKLALTTENAFVVLLAHSNFGIGPAFGATGCNSLSDFANVAGGDWSAGGYYTAIDWNYLRTDLRQKHSNLEVKDPEIAKDPQNYIIDEDKMNIPRFPNNSNVAPGQKFTLTKNASRYNWYHFIRNGAKRLIVKSGQDDLPAKNLRYKVFYYAGCTTIMYYWEVFQYGTVLLVKPVLATEYKPNAAPKTFVKAIIEEGEDGDKIKDKLNKVHGIAEDLTPVYKYDY